MITEADPPRVPVAAACGGTGRKRPGGHFRPSARSRPDGQPAQDTKFRAAAAGAAAASFMSLKGPGLNYSAARPPR